jgi:microcin C transport system permease protein
MVRYIIRRLLLIVPTLIGVTLVVFLLTQFVPGGPVEAMISKVRSQQSARGGEASKQMSEEEIRNIKAYFGFDKPMHIRYFRWLGGVVRGDLGRSFAYQQPVSDVIFSKVPISLFFGISSLVIAYAVSVPLGLLKAVRHGSGFDAVTSITILAGYVIPGWTLGIFLLVFLAGGTFVDLFPLGGIVSENFEYLDTRGKLLDFLHHMVLPLTCWVVGSFAFLTLLMKNSVVEELNKDYVRTELAKGSAYTRVVGRAVLRNALVPLVTGLGGIFSVMFAGALLIERVFDIDGMGLLFYNSIVGRDYNVVMGIILLSGFTDMLGRLLSDVLYAVVDPRIRLD